MAQVAASVEEIPVSSVQLTVRALADADVSLENPFPGLSAGQGQGKAPCPQPQDQEAEDTKPPLAAPKVLALLWPALLCVFVDYLGLAIAIPILPFFTLELPWNELTTVCPSCPQVT